MAMATLSRRLMAALPAMRHARPATTHHLIMTQGALRSITSTRFMRADKPWETQSGGDESIEDGSLDPPGTPWAPAPVAEDYDNTVAVLLHGRKVTEALDIFSRMVQRGFKPSSETIELLYEVTKAKPEWQAAAVATISKLDTSDVLGKGGRVPVLKGVVTLTTTHWGMERYEVLKPIGKGKFAVVYRAKLKEGDEQLVALKKISIDMMDEKARNKCLKEVRLLQSLDHPNIIKYLDSFLDGSDLVIVVEWAAAGDLKRQIRKAQERGVRFEERVIWKYFVQICEAIKHMHEKRILHRDLKPANIFLTTNGVVKVGDLGLGRSMGEHSMQAHSKVGTPLYMSPEVLRGDGYDWKSDIWSLGCLLYEMAMLKSPFKSEGLNLYSLFQKISRGDYAPLPEQYSKELRELASMMISTDAFRRPDIDMVCRVAHEMRTRTSRAAAVPHAVAGSSRAGGQAAVAGPQDDHKVAPRPEGESEGKEVESVAKLAHDGGAAGPQPPRMTSSGSRGLKAASEPKPRQGLESEKQNGYEKKSLGHHQDEMMNGTSNGAAQVTTPAAAAASSAVVHSKSGVAAAEPRERAGGVERGLTMGRGDDGPAQQAPSLGETLAVMESAWEKLMVLGYWEEQRKKGRRRHLTRHHFALDTSGQRGISKHQQFWDFVGVSRWLLSKLGIDVVVEEEEDAPLTVASAILAASQTAGFVDDLWANRMVVTPTALTKAYGPAVCHLLLWLVDKAMGKVLSNHRPLQYVGMDGKVIEDGLRRDEPVDIIDKEDDGEEVVEQIPRKGSRKGAFQQEEDIDEAQEEEQGEIESEWGPPQPSPRETMLVTQVDPRRWRAECERVGPRLPRQVGEDPQEKGWCRRLRSIHDHLEKVQTYVDTSALRSRHGRHHVSGAEVPVVHVNSLSILAERAGREIDAVQAGERRIMCNPVFARLTHEREVGVKELEEVRSQLGACQESLREKMAKLAHVTQKSDEAAHRLEAKVAEDLMGPANIVKMRKALHKLKAEIKHMALHEGFLSQQLMRRQLAHAGFPRGHSGEDESCYTELRSDIVLASGGGGDLSDSDITSHRPETSGMKKRGSALWTRRGPGADDSSAGSTLTGDPQVQALWD